MVERAGNFLLAEPRAVVALDEESDAAPGVDMARPGERAIERVELL